MQVIRIIVGRINVDMMDDLTLGSIHDFAVLPFTSRALRPVAKSVVPDQRAMNATGLLNGRVRCWLCLSDDLRNWRDHHIAAPLVRAVRHAVDLFLVSVERIAVAVPHLVVANAEFSRSRGPVTMLACPSDNLSAPTVFGRSVPLPSLVMHQAKPMRGVLASAFGYGAKAVLFWWCHMRSLTRSKDSWQLYQPVFHQYYQEVVKALGNSMAVPCMAWVGSRIQQVQAILSAGGNANA